MRRLRNLFKPTDHDPNTPSLTAISCNYDNDYYGDQRCDQNKALATKTVKRARRIEVDNPAH